MAIFKAPTKQSLTNKLFKAPPSVHLVVLNWNRLDLLKRTVNSLLATSPTSWPLTIVDNNSSDGSRVWITELCELNPRVQCILYSENAGAESLNPLLTQIKSEFILISENDLEYKQGWYLELLCPFYLFKNLGQISPFSPFPDNNIGEVWTIKPHKEIALNGCSIYEALENVGTTSLIRRTLISKGVRWKNIIGSDKSIKMPSDGEFSGAIKSKGYFAAWAKTPQVINWGHNPDAWSANPDYYLKNWTTKSQLNIDGLEKLEEIQKEVSNISNEKRELFLVSKIGQILQELNMLRSKFLLLQRSHPNKDLLNQIGAIAERSTLYFGSKSIYSPEKQITLDWTPSANTIKFTFQLPKMAGIDELRWDPIEGVYCRLKIESLSIEDSNGKSTEIAHRSLRFSLNECENEWVTFKTTDPMIFIPMDKAASKLSIFARIELII